MAKSLNDGQQTASTVFKMYIFNALCEHHLISFAWVEIKEQIFICGKSPSICWVGDPRHILLYLQSGPLQIFEAVLGAAFRSNVIDVHYL